jgi:hypothetical protein
MQFFDKVYIPNYLWALHDFAQLWYYKNILIYYLISVKTYTFET